MRKQAVAPNRAPMVMEPAASKTGLPVTCTSSVATPAAASPLHAHQALLVQDSHPQRSIAGSRSLPAGWNSSWAAHRAACLQQGHRLTER